MGGIKRRELIPAMVESLRGYWRTAAGYQKFLYIVGALLLLSAAFHTGVLIATGGTLAGLLSWRKPILFGESFGLTALSLAWFMSFLPRRPWLWLLAGPLGVVNLGEVFIISMQQWRGVPSHFNSATPFDAAAIGTAGLLIAIAGLVTVLLAGLVFSSLQAPPSLAGAIRASMVLLLAAHGFGWVMIASDSSTFGAAGAMKVPHALAVHAPQVLPALAWLLLFSNWSEGKRTRVVLAGSLGYTLLVVVGAWQTFSGRAPLDLEAGPTLLLALGALLFAGAYGASLLGLQPKAEPATGWTR